MNYASFSGGLSHEFCYYKKTRVKTTSQIRSESTRPKTNQVHYYRSEGIHKRGPDPTHDIDPGDEYTNQ